MPIVDESREAIAGDTLRISRCISLRCIIGSLHCVSPVCGRRGLLGTQILLWVIPFNDIQHADRISAVAYASSGRVKFNVNPRSRHAESVIQSCIGYPWSSSQQPFLRG